MPCLEWKWGGRKHNSAKNSGLQLIVTLLRLVTDFSKYFEKLLALKKIPETGLKWSDCGGVGYSVLSQCQISGGYRTPFRRLPSPFFAFLPQRRAFGLLGSDENLKRCLQSSCKLHCDGAQHWPDRRFSPLLQQYVFQTLLLDSKNI